MTLAIVILAAGKGTRMRSDKPKVLHEIAGIPMIKYILNNAIHLKPEEIYIVYGFNGEKLKMALSDFDSGSVKIKWVEQAEQKGSGHAALMAVRDIAATDAAAKQVLILSGDMPLIRFESLERLIKNTLIQTASGRNCSLSILTANMTDPTGFGRIIRDKHGEIIGVKEDLDALAWEKEILEVNVGAYFGEVVSLNKWIQQIGTTNNKGEYYLTDIIALAHQDGIAIQSELIHPDEVIGINTRQQLEQAERVVQMRQVHALMREGVTVLDASRLYIRGKVVTATDVTIDTNVILEGNVTLGCGVYIGANCIIKDSVIEAGAVIKANSIVENSVVGNNSIIGPFARLRAGTVTLSNVEIGNFVETKNTVIQENSKAKHLSYLGDAEIGKHVNIGAGTITCNYDGKAKHKTIVHDHVAIGAGTELIAPINIGEGAIIGAGTTLLSDAPAHKVIINKKNQVVLRDAKIKNQDKFNQEELI